MLLFRVTNNFSCYFFTETLNNQRQCEEENEEYVGSLVGFKATTWCEIYEIYKKHANALGFGIRKSTTRCTQGSNRKIRSKEFVCSKEGFRCTQPIKHTTGTSESKRKTKQVPITRIGCKAYIRVKVNSDGMFEVDDHVMTHNHEMTKKKWQHLHRSERKITGEKAKAIDLMLESGLKPTQTFNLMVQELGGINSVGHTLIDHINYISR